MVIKTPPCSRTLFPLAQDRAQSAANKTFFDPRDPVEGRGREGKTPRVVPISATLQGILNQLNVEWYKAKVTSAVFADFYPQRPINRDLSGAV